MSLTNLKATLKAELRRWRTAASVALLAALPWAAEIKSFAASNLPQLQPYLPENVYKFMGGAVVVMGIVLNFVSTHRALSKVLANENADA